MSKETAEKEKSPGRSRENVCVRRGLRLYVRHWLYDFRQVGGRQETLRYGAVRGGFTGVGELSPLEVDPSVFYSNCTLGSRRGLTALTTSLPPSCRLKTTHKITECEISLSVCLSLSLSLSVCLSVCLSALACERIFIKMHRMESIIICYRTGKYTLCVCVCVSERVCV